MIQNQTVSPFVTVKKGMKANQPRFAGNQPSFKNSSTLERTPSSDSYRAPAPAPQSMTPIAVGMGVLGAATLGVAFLTHKNTGEITKLIEKLTPKTESAAVSGGDGGATVVDKGLSIWGDMYLNLKKDKQLSPESVKSLQNNIGRALNGEAQMTPVTNPKLWSISYEGFGGMAGGQHDIANEFPEAIVKQGVDTHAVAPLFKISEETKGGSSEVFSLKPVEGQENTFVYTTKQNLPGIGEIPEKDEAGNIKYKKDANGNDTDKPEMILNKVIVKKVHSGKVNGNDTEVYYGELKLEDKDEKGNNKVIKTLFVHDKKMFDFGVVKKPDIYQNLPHSKEKPRMAQFMCLVHDTMMKAHEGVIKVPGANGAEEALAAPHKVVAHEMWQSGFLLEKLRLASVAEKQDKLAAAAGNKELEAKVLAATDYQEKVADNTALVGHNVGISYQGWSSDKAEMEEIQNMLYGDYSHSITENALILDKDERTFGLFKTENQRVGFVGDSKNHAQSSTVLGSKIGGVSEGSTEEMVNEGTTGRLTPVFELKDAVGAVEAFPNGINKRAHAASKENIERLMNRKPEIPSGRKDATTGNLIVDAKGKPEMQTLGCIKEHVKRLFKDDSMEIKPYLEKHTDVIESPEAIQKYAETRAHNTKISVTLLKDVIGSYKSAPVASDGSRDIRNAPPLFANMHKVTIMGDKHLDFSDVDPNAEIPFFSLASRLDPQKGFDTTVDAVEELVKNWTKELGEKPIILVSGEGHPATEKHIIAVKERMGEAGNRVVFVKNRMDDQGLMTVNMTSQSMMPSRDEPFGISDQKGKYAGSYAIVTPVGGMKPSGKISRKTYDYNNVAERAVANAITVEGYENEAKAGGKVALAKMRKRNAKRLAAAMKTSITMPKADALRMNINALNSDISWEKGAIQNYMKILKITVDPTKPVAAPL